MSTPSWMRPSPTCARCLKLSEFCKCHETHKVVVAPALDVAKGDSKTPILDELRSAAAEAASLVDPEPPKFTWTYDDDPDKSVVRRFASGATRDVDTGKYEYARAFDPKVLEARAAYMDKHRHLRDGTLREPDDWKKGMPIRTYMDGLMRHVMDVWLIHDHGQAVRPESGEHVDLKEALCAVMFNAEGWLHALLTEEDHEVD